MVPKVTSFDMILSAILTKNVISMNTGLGCLTSLIFKLGTDAAHTEEMGPMMMLISGSRSTVCHLGLHVLFYVLVSW